MRISSNKRKPKLNSQIMTNALTLHKPMLSHKTRNRLLKTEKKEWERKCKRGKRANDCCACASVMCIL